MSSVKVLKLETAWNYNMLHFHENSQNIEFLLHTTNQRYMLVRSCVYLLLLDR